MNLQRLPFLCLFVFAIVFVSSSWAYTDLEGEIYDGNGGPLTAGTYNKTGRITVPEGQTLTIQEGAIIKFRRGQRDIEVLGALNVQGTETNKVVFTSRDDNDIGEQVPDSDGDPNPGDWPRVKFEEGSAGTISHAIFRYGGRWGGGTNTHALEIDGDVTINDCLFAHNINSAIKIRSDITVERTTIRNTENGSGIQVDAVVSATIRDCLIENNEDAAVYLDDPTNLITCSFSNITARGNNINGIEVDGTISRSGDITVTTLPVCIDWDLEIGTEDPAEPDVRVNVGPGVVFKFEHRLIRVYDELNFNGTTASPIILTSEEDDTIAGDTRSDGNEKTPAPGQWSKVEYRDGSRGTLSHCVVRYGGRWGGGTNTHVLDIYSNTAVEVTNCVFENNMNSAINVNGDATLNGLVISNTDNGDGILIGDSVNAIVTDCTITDNEDSAIYLEDPTNLITCTFSNITAQNNDYNAIRTEGMISLSGEINVTTLPIDVDWDLEVGSDDTDVPDVVVDVGPGVVFKFGGRALVVFDGDELNLNGTAASPIVLTSEEDDTVGGDTRSDGDEKTPEPGQWPKLQYGQGSQGNISHAIVRYGGKWGGGTDTDMMQIDADSLSMSDVIAEYAANDGIALMNGTYSLERVTARYNGDNGIWLGDEGSTSISSSSIVSNDDDGIRMEDNHSLQAVSLVVSQNGDDGFDIRSEGDIAVNRSDIVDNEDWGVGMDVTQVADFTQNYWGDPSGPLDEDDSVNGETDSLNLQNLSSTGSTVTDFVNWGNPNPNQWFQPAATELEPIMNGFSIVLLHTMIEPPPIFGNNIVACQNDETIAVASRGDQGDYLVWYSQAGIQDILRTPPTVRIRGVVPGGPNSLQIIVENVQENVWIIYKVTGPIIANIPSWFYR